MTKEKKEYKAPIVEVIDYEYTGILCQSPGVNGSGGQDVGVDSHEDTTSEP